jgi:CDGSH-type Zn-finger protein
MDTAKSVRALEFYPSFRYFVHWNLTAIDGASNMGNEKKTDDRPRDGKSKIRVTKNGPYLVSGGIPLVEQIIGIDAEGNPRGWRTGKKYPTQENYSLCRCGRSKNAPFCDEMHIEANFKGSETAKQQPYLSQAETIEGPTLILTDAIDLCSIAGFCERAGGIWKLTKQSGEVAARQTAIEEAGDCPAGRLVVWDKKTKEAIEPRFEQTIGVIKDPRNNRSGPIWVRGGISIESADGTTYEVRNRVTLCCCGKSRNKPFCDGSHP